MLPLKEHAELKIRLAAALRVVGFMLGGAFAVVAALALMVWISFDAEGTGNLLTHHFKERYQRVLILESMPRLHIWPHPVLELNGVSLTEKGGDELFARARQIRLDLTLLGLLLRRPEVTRASFDDLELTLQRTQGSGWNVSSFMDDPVISPSPLPWRIKPDEVVVHGGVLHLDDGREDIRADFRAVALDATDLNAKGPARLELQGQWLAQDGGIDMHFSARTGFVLGEQFEAASLERLQLRLEGNDGRLKGATVEFESANLNWSDAGGSGKVDQPALHLQGAWGQQNLEVSTRAQQLGWHGGQLEGSQLHSEAILRELGGQTRLKWTWPALTGIPGGFSAAGAVLDWQSRYGERGADGKLQGKLAANLHDGSYVLDAIQSEITLRHPALRGGSAPLRLTGRLDWSQAGNTGVHLQGALGESSLQADANLIRIDPPAGQVSLQVGRLDLDRLLVHRPGVPPPAWLHQLDKPDLRGDLKIEGLKVAGMQLENLLVPFNISAGSLNAAGVSGSLYSGRFGGDLVAHAADGSIEGTGEFREIALEPLVRDTGVPVILTGRASGSYHLSSRIAEKIDPLAELSGAVRWTVTGAGLRGVDLMRSLHVFRQAIEAGQQSARTPMASENTDLGVAGSRFVIENGMIRAENLLTRNNWLAISGNGTASLLKDELDFNLQAMLQPGIVLTPGKDLASLRMHPLGLRLKGARMHPDIRFEPKAPTALANVAGKKK